jgi:phosphonate transport system substrate-binding protein
MYRRSILGAALVALVVFGLRPAGAQPATETDRDAQALRVGLVRSLFRDVPPTLAQASIQPFSELVRSQTGLNCRAVVAGDALSLAAQLSEDKVQFAVFHGVEFAWAQEKFPDLRPLVIAINRLRHLRAILVTRHDSDVKTVADLKGKPIALPRRSREHCHLFLERQCRELDSTPKAFFADVVAYPTIEGALDDVLRRKVQAAVVDNVSLGCYERLKPGCHAGLKVLQQSCVFPAAVLAYHRGALDQSTLNRLRGGLIKANQNVRGKELMFLWNLTAFENVPADFTQILTSVVREYPAPAVAGPANEIAAPE